MADKKPPEDEFIDDSFEEEFKLEEESSTEATNASVSSFIKKRVSQKHLLIGISVVVLGFLGYSGYRLFHTKPATINPNLPLTSKAGSAQTNKQPNTQTSAKPKTSSTVQNPADLVMKPQPTAITEQDVAGLLPTKAAQPEEKKASAASSQPAVIETSLIKPGEGAGAAEPSKTAEPPKTEENKTTSEAGLPSTIGTPTAAEMQEFHQQTQKTLEAFTKLNQQMENNLNQIKYLDSYTREVSLTVEKLNAQVTAMDNRIQALTHLANSLSKDLSKVRNEVGYVKRVIGDDGLDIPPASITSRQRLMDAPYPNTIEDGIDCSAALTATRKKGGQGIKNEDLEYIVHAVIPGRAWLKSAKGQIITVTEGENLGNYGKILVIDAANGVVLTSSGIAFR